MITDQTVEEVEANFAGKGYAQLKGELAEVTNEFLRPIQERLREYTDDVLDNILSQGREKASEIATMTLRNVYERTGLWSLKALGQYGRNAGNSSGRANRTVKYTA